MKKLKWSDVTSDPLVQKEIMRLKQEIEKQAPKNVREVRNLLRYADTLLEMSESQIERLIRTPAVITTPVH